MPASTNRHTTNPFKSVTAYIVDDADPGPPPTGRNVFELIEGGNFNLHQLRCRLVRAFFTKYTPYEVHGANVPVGQRVRVFDDFWQAELSTRGPSDLIIIYLNGDAYGNGEDYTWKLKGRGRREIDAYAFIDTLIASGVDCMLILDAYIPTRFHEKWSSPNTNNVEIITRGERMPDRQGRPTEGDADFTDAVFSTLAVFLKGIHDQFKKCDALRSIPELMKSNKEINANPVRVWLDRTGMLTKDERLGLAPKKVVKRIKVSPTKMRESGKIEFFSVTIQGGAEAEKDGEEEGVGEDEGIDVTGVPAVENLEAVNEGGKGLLMGE